MNDAAKAQYATPTPGPCVTCTHVAPPVQTSLPHTGFDIAPLLIVGVIVLVLGLRGRHG